MSNPQCIVQPGCMHCSKWAESQIPFGRYQGEYSWSVARERVCLVFHGRYEVTPVQILDVEVEGLDGTIVRVRRVPDEWDGIRKFFGSTPVTMRLICGTNANSVEITSGTIRVGQRFAMLDSAGNRGLTELPIAHIILG